VLRARTPLVLGVVAALAFLVLMAAFRSITLPLSRSGSTLLSVGAACGLVTLIFQDGNLQGCSASRATVRVSQWVPLFTFVLLFGLSMDYHVFILSRIRERWTAGASTPDAVVGGIAGSAGVVTSAAVIMVAVFSIFATLSFIDVKMLGVGLAFAVLLDATIVRGILVPAAMALLGERCWYCRDGCPGCPGRCSPRPHRPRPIRRDRTGGRPIRRDRPGGHPGRQGLTRWRPSRAGRRQDEAAMTAWSGGAVPARKPGRLRARALRRVRIS